MATRQKIGQYFCVSLTEVRAIVHYHLLNPTATAANSDAIAVYLILCRGAGKNNTTSWKAYGICKRTHLTMKRAEQALSWLIENGFIAKIVTEIRMAEAEDAIGERTESSGSVADATSGAAQLDQYEYEIIRHHAGECVFLPNLIVDGQAGHNCDPAIKRMLLKSQGDFRIGITLQEARLDAILLLLRLYGMHNLDSHGGVSPDVWRGSWICGPRQELFEDFRTSSSIRDETFDVFGAGPDHEVFDTSFLNDMFTYIQDETRRARRLEYALKHLRASRLLYQVVQVWGRIRGSHQSYELLYPLHIIDNAQRNQDEPAIGPSVLELVARQASSNHIVRQEYLRIASSDMQDADIDYSSSNLNGVFFIAAKGVSMLPLTSLRLRYRAHDADTALGLGEQHRMAETWRQTLETLRQ